MSSAPSKIVPIVAPAQPRPLAQVIPFEAGLPTVTAPSIEPEQTPYSVRRQLYTSFWFDFCCFILLALLLGAALTHR